MSQDVTDIVISLRSQIEANNKSVAEFCRANNICRFNLSKVFQNPQKISVGLFLRINEALGVLASGTNENNFFDNMRLCDYMDLDFYSVNRAIIHSLRSS